MSISARRDSGCMRTWMRASWSASIGAANNAPASASRDALRPVASALTSAHSAGRNSASENADFENASFADGRLTRTAVALEPGIYQYSYVLRVVAGGRYSVPAPSARAADGASGIGNAATLDVEGR